MPAPIDDERRQAILADIRAGLGCRATARKHGVSPATVSALAKADVGATAFDRSGVEKATRAHEADAKALRAQLALDLLADAQRLRQRAWEPYTTFTASAGGPAWVTTRRPPPKDAQACYTAMAIAVDKSLALDRHDSDGGAAAGRSMVNDLFAALGLAYGEMVAEEQGSPRPLDDPAGGSPEVPPAGSTSGTGR